MVHVFGKGATLKSSKCLISFLLMIFMLLLMSCGGQVVWYKKGQTQADFNRDSAECLLYADTYARDATIGQRRNNELFSKFYINCLTDKGWSKAPPGQTDGTASGRKGSSRSLIEFNPSRLTLETLGISLNLPRNSTLSGKQISSFGPVIQENYNFNLPSGFFLNIISQQSLGVVFEKDAYPANDPYAIYEQGVGELQGKTNKWTFFCGPSNDSWIGGLGTYIFSGRQKRIVITVTRVLSVDQASSPAGLRLNKSQFKAMEGFRSAIQRMFPGLIPEEDSGRNYFDFNLVPK